MKLDMLLQVVLLLQLHLWPCMTVGRHEHFVLPQSSGQRNYVSTHADMFWREMGQLLRQVVKKLGQLESRNRRSQDRPFSEPIWTPATFFSTRVHDWNTHFSKTLPRLQTLLCPQAADSKTLIRKINVYLQSVETAEDHHLINIRRHSTNTCTLPNIKNRWKFDIYEGRLATENVLKNTYESQICKRLMSFSFRVDLKKTTPYHHYFSTYTEPLG
jgi:hypothetical protein